MAQPLFELVPTGENRAFIFKIDRDLWPVYHYHPEFDILLSLKDHAGEFISGDHIGPLEDGTLFMNGPNIPHVVHSGIPDEKDWARPSLAVIQFSAESLGDQLLAKHELAPVKQFLHDARDGFEFHGETRERARQMILAMRDMDEMERFLQLLRLLRLFADSIEKTRLASPAYSPSLRDRDIDRMGAVIQYLRERKTEEVTLEEVASLVNMSPRSFCRFFKANTGKTLTRYLNELRVGEACKLLLETEQPVTEIAFEAGFSNLSNFNRRFREIKALSPREFRALRRIDESRQSEPLPAQQTFA